MSMHSLTAPAGQPNVQREKDILGVNVAPFDRAEAIDFLAHRIQERRFTKIGFLNAHIANIASTDARFAALLSDFVVLADGVGVDMAAKILYGAPFPANLNGTDFIPAFLKSQQKPLSVGLLGASRDNVEQAAERLREMLPHHLVTVVHDGFFDAAAEDEILARLRQQRPDVLLVAMGVPRQEYWIDDRLSADHCTTAFAVGALFDFLSGAIPRAPSWVRWLRLEWLFRLGLEPARLWRRYIVGNPLFLFRVLLQKLRRAGPAA
ncbi:WecB/TagA/CpsF family glycosyltransferase [Nitratireductor sp. CAU 1489]|uniref:WecB/TagA/CpsF family glycosyltransferase n=1 Tax=Nitratireductor arenosus TaxID=2682096 RepID=A0A844QK55_9HYPH|nr:WecB/TagA/CpsF family glycosyltransferase [Nitratireductor arenosus]MVA99685.1 WecB/TagA/CpsF family glycosyltransferase [Nitratireductor arenosus]